MTKYTKGKWYVEKGEGEQGEEIWITIGPPTGHIIATLNPYNHFDADGAEANARLIALAPEYDTRLRSIVKMFDEEMFIWGEDDTPMVEKEIADARALLARLEE